MNRLALPKDVPYATYDIESRDPFEGIAVVSVLGDLATLAQLDRGPLVRMHSACVYGDALAVGTCECGPQLNTARQRIIDARAGILFYLLQEGRGAGLPVKARGYELKHTEGLDTAAAYDKMGIPFDQRQYGHCARFLLERGIDEIRLMSNNPRKISALEVASIAVNREPLIVGVTKQNRDYLETKCRVAGHLIEFPDENN